MEIKCLFVGLYMGLSLLLNGGAGASGGAETNASHPGNAPWQHLDGQIVDVHSTCMPMHMHRHNIQSTIIGGGHEIYRFEIMS